MVEPNANRPRSYDGDYMELGKVGEQIVMDWLRARQDVSSVEDLRGDLDMQAVDVDIAMHLQDDRRVLAEIKTDSHMGVSGNVLFEVMRINHTAPEERCATLGWSVRTHAKWVFIYAPSVNRIYWAQIDSLRYAFQKYTQNTRQKMRLIIVPTDDIKTTVNVLIPYGECESIFQAVDVAARKDAS